ncbi:MAG TPA: hypothetical protein PLQ93_00715 [Bacteroidia bacterium]|nr:hypothetical protein [Bacteroidia bacterium]
MNRILYYISICICVVFLSACEKTKNQVNQATEFTMDYSTNISLPAPVSTVNLSVPVDYTTPDIPTGSATRFASEGTTKDLIDDISLTKFNISTTGSNLDFLKSINISIKATGLAETAVASKTLIPSGITNVSADLSQANIKEYIFKDNIQFKLSIVVNANQTGTQTLKLDQSVTVKGKKIK